MSEARNVYLPSGDELLEAQKKEFMDSDYSFVINDEGE